MKFVRLCWHSLNPLINVMWSVVSFQISFTGIEAKSETGCPTAQWVSYSYIICLVYERSCDTTNTVTHYCTVDAHQYTRAHTGTCYHSGIHNFLAIVSIHPFISPLHSLQVVRRLSKEEEILVLFKENVGHSCDNKFSVVSMVIWDAFPKDEMNRIYHMLTGILPKYGMPTIRKCGANET